MGVTWEEAFETGHAEIDQQHRELLALVDDLESAQEESPQTLLRVLQHVMDFTHTHFLMEEVLMVEVGYPSRASEEMIAQHAEFTSYARLRVLEFRKGAPVSVLPLQSFLAEWLTRHEFGLDRLLADFIRRQARESAPEGLTGATT
jgi:hemerythrin